jgi:hypothetical protein
MGEGADGEGVATADVGVTTAGVGGAAAGSGAGYLALTAWLRSAEARILRR